MHAPDSNTAHRNGSTAEERPEDWLNPQISQEQSIFYTPIVESFGRSSSVDEFQRRP
jgi:hypothetical protein